MRRRLFGAGGLLLISTISLSACGQPIHRHASISSKSSASTTSAPHHTTSSVASPWKLAVNTTSLTVGGTVTLMGTNCPGATEIIASPGSQDMQPAGPLRTWRDGNWSQSFTVPEEVVGATSVAAQCVEHGPLGTLGALEVSYPAVAVTITTPYQLHVEPSGTVAPGANLNVSSVGGGCPDAYFPIVDLENPKSPPSTVPGPNTVYGKQSNGENWTVVLPIPSATAPGQYVVVVRCYYDRGFSSRTYQPVPITVN